MRTALALLLLSLSLFSATLLNQNLYERPNRVDLMLSFDTPFKGSVIKRAGSGGSVDILLTDVQVGKPFYKALRDSFVDSVAVTGTGGKKALVKIVPAKGALKVQASKTVDGFGLRLRVTPAPAAEKSQKAAPPVPNVLEKIKAERAAAEKRAARPPEALPTLAESETVAGWRYWTVLGILLLLLLILWAAKRKGLKNLGKGAGWLMPKSAGPLPDEAVIRFQKPLDPHNRVVLIEFNGRQYLMVVGNTNVLLDTFGEGRIEEEEEFARMFEANKRQLDHFLKENHPDAFDAFDTFKANAAKEERP